MDGADVARRVERRLTWLTVGSAGVLVPLGALMTLIALGREPIQGGALVTGLLMLWLGVMGPFVHARRRRQDPRAHLEVGDLDGRPATILMRAHQDGLTAVGSTGIALGFAAWGVLAGSGGRWPVGLALLGAAAWLMTLPLGIWTGRFGSGGLWLTPELVEHRHRGRRSLMRWDDVEAVVPVWPHARLVGRPGAEVSHQDLTPWLPSRKPSAGPQDVDVDVAGLRVDLGSLVEWLDRYRRDPLARIELGTEESLAHLR